MTLEEIKYQLQQSQFRDYSDEKKDLINQIEFIQNLEWEVREKFSQLNQKDSDQPEEGDVIFEKDEL